MSARDRVAAILASYRDDPVGFCRTFLEMEPHPGQAKWLSDSTNVENALVTGNRFGKSFVAAAKRIYKCVYKKGWTKATEQAMRRKGDDYHSINVAQSADQSRLVFDKAIGLLQNPRISYLVKSVKRTPFPIVEFANGARFEARNTSRQGIYLLGHDYDDINFDEAAYEKHFLKVRDNVLRMRLVDRDGRMDYTSTGNGRNAFGMYFLDGVNGKNPDLYTQTGTSFDNPFISREALERNARVLPEQMRQQNIEGAIIDFSGSYFAGEVVDDALDDELNDGILIEYDPNDEAVERHVVVHVVEGDVTTPYFERYPDHRYLHGWDLADKHDKMVGTTWDLSTTPIRLVEFERFNKRGWEFNWARIRARHHRYGTPQATKIDATGIGDVAMSELRDIQAEGVNFAGKKDALLTNLNTALALRELRWPFIKVLIDEFKFYSRDDANLSTDCVMSCAVAMWFARNRTVNYYIGGAIDEPAVSPAAGSDAEQRAAAELAEAQKRIWG